MLKYYSSYRSISIDTPRLKPLLRAVVRVSSITYLCIYTNYHSTFVITVITAGGGVAAIEDLLLKL